MENKYDDMLFGLCRLGGKVMAYTGLAELITQETSDLLSYACLFGGIILQEIPRFTENREKTKEIDATQYSLSELEKASLKGWEKK